MMFPGPVQVRGCDALRSRFGVGNIDMDWDGMGLELRRGMIRTLKDTV